MYYTLPTQTKLFDEKYMNIFILLGYFLTFLFHRDSDKKTGDIIREF